MTTKPPEGYAKKSPLCRGCGAGLGEYHHLYDGFCSTCIETERDTLRVRLEAADKSDRHNEAVINELKRQLTEAVQERNTAHAVGFEACSKLTLEYNLLQHISEGKCRCDPDVGASPCMPCAAGWIISKIRALLPQPGDQAKE